MATRSALARVVVSLASTIILALVAFGIAGAQTCPAGKYGPSGMEPCSNCPSGTFSGPGSESCNACPAGSFSGAGSASCTPCQPGYASPTFGSASCAPCAAGTFASGHGSTSCMNCPEGSIAPFPGTTSCQPCAEGTTSDSTHTTCIATTAVNPNAAGLSFLSPVSPNPASGPATIAFGLTRDSRVRLRIVDVVGRPVRDLKRSALTAGTHRITWDLRTNEGSLVSPGLYFADLRIDGARRSRPVMVVR